MKNLRKAIANFLNLFFTRYKIQYSYDLPEHVKNKRIYIIGDLKEPWLLMFKCPCGCKNTIQLNLLKEASPQWRFSLLSRKRITISPSISRTTGCRSHFFVINSKTKWI